MSTVKPSSSPATDAPLQFNSEIFDKLRKMSDELFSEIKTKWTEAAEIHEREMGVLVDDVKEDLALVNHEQQARDAIIISESTTLRKLSTFAANEANRLRRTVNKAAQAMGREMKLNNNQPTRPCTTPAPAPLNPAKCCACQKTLEDHDPKSRKKNAVCTQCHGTTFRECGPKANSAGTAFVCTVCLRSGKFDQGTRDMAMLDRQLTSALSQKQKKEQQERSSIVDAQNADFKRVFGKFSWVSQSHL